MSGVGRGRGRPARIDRRRILDAALELDAAGEPLSMKAVADRLGVQRPNLYHHVADREALVAMVAAARIEEALDESWMPAPDAGWACWLRAFARATRDAMLAAPQFVEYVELGGPAGRRQLAQLEALHAALVRDGFAPADAGRCVTMVAELVHINARAVFVMRGQGREPHREAVADVMREEPDAWPFLRAAGMGGPDAEDPDAQFAFDLETAIAGMAALLERGAGD